VNRSKAKGTAAETAVVGYLRQWFPRAERRALHGAQDRGDIAGVPRAAVEVKAGVKPSFGAWLAEAERERIAAGAMFGAVVHKPRGVGGTRVADWHVVMTLATFAQLLRTSNDHEEG
jgi:hypothetical protein